jgi:MYXO-CTERM domain-containing protein
MNALRLRNLGTMRSVLGVGCFGVALAVPLSLSSPASAQVACGDTTCPKGFDCQAMPGACPAIACLEGSECPVCTPTEQHYCTPAACATNADCGTDMVCNERDQMTCTATDAAPRVACPPDQKCEVPVTEPPVCTTTKVKECVYRWQLPCQADADCGAGFSCKELQTCMCSGSSGAVARAGSGAAVPVDVAPSGTGGVPSTPESSCTCEPSGVKTCEMIEVACTVDADCASGWTCQDNPEGVCWATSTGESGCTPADPPRYCVPPGWAVARDAATLGVQTTVATGESGSNASTPPSAASPTPAAPAAPAATTPTAPATEAGGGCSTAPTPGSAWSWMVLGLGALLGLRRRQR